MRLVRLSVLRGDSVVREVKFKSGLNLVLDKSISASTKSGNNVGKTTLIRLIDFCLGSDGVDIWQDPEFKTVNQEVFDFLHGVVPVSVRLDMMNYLGVTHSLVRSFGGKSKTDRPTFYADDKQIKKISDYRTTVKFILFGSQAPKPTLRQLAPKFIRSSPTTI